MPARILPLALLLLAGAANSAERPMRYAALLTDGKRIESDRLSNWHDERGVPQLGGQPLLAPANPVRWLRNRAERPGELPAAYVEFTSGDRLPGTVVGYKTGTEDPYGPLPPHLIVQVAVSFEPPENRPVKEIRVAAQFVRRIVWQRRRGSPSQPGAAQFRDGRSLAVRAVRFHATDVHLLSADGDERIEWSELAELSLPPVDPWAAWFDGIAAVCPTAAMRWIEIETSSGLVAAASLARFAARFEGNSSDPDRWVHGIQPAWSLDILWVPCREIVLWRTFATHEVPLSRITPRQVVHHGGLGGPRAVQVDRSNVGTPLQSAALEFGWGLGVSGGTELIFDLPPHARTLRASVCLDRAAGDGGCIRPRILAGSAGGKPLWEGPVLVGSRNVADTGPIGLGGLAAGQRSIVFQIDAVLTGRPAGADPLDIRDHADWCDPLLSLDPAAVQAELEQRLPRQFAAWRGWTAQWEDSAGLELSFYRDDGIPGTFHAGVRSSKLPLVLRRELAIGPSDEWLVIAAAAWAKNRRDQPQIEVRIGGEVAGRFSVPDRQDDLDENRPLAVPLKEYQRSAAIVVEIRQLADDRSPPVSYRVITTSGQLPTVQRVIEEEATLTAVEAQQGTATMVALDRYVGVRSLRVTPAGRFRLELAVPIRVRARPKWGEARFIRFAVKKSGGGRFALELEKGPPRDEPARYDLGRGEPSYGSATRVWQDNLPPEWVVITRDLFGDFGDLDVQALLVGCPDGDFALLDHVYLARHPSDFELIPTLSAPPRER